MRIKIEEIDLDPSKIIAERGLALGGSAQKYMETAVIRRCIDYVPADEMFLSNSARPWPQPGDGYVKWGGQDVGVPYAHYQYMGEVYGPNIPKFEVDKITGEKTLVGFWSPPGIIKQPTGANLSYSKEKHQQAGSHWVERMMANDGDQLLEEVAAYAGGKAGK